MELKLSRALWASVLAFGMVACTTEDGTDKETDTDTDTECDNSVTTFPNDGATGVYYRTAIEVAFRAAEDDAVFTLTAGDSDVAFTGEWDGNTYFITPDAPLEPSTQYTLDVTYSCGSLEPPVSFTTSEVGGELDGDTIDSIVGSVYNIDITGGRVVEPAGIGDLLTGALDEGISVLVSATEYNMDDEELTFVGALGQVDDDDNITQDICEPSIAFPEAADFSGNPFFSAGGENVALSVAGIDLIVDRLIISGAYAPDGSYLAGITFDATVDTRPLVPLFDDDPEAPDDAICTLVGNFGVACEACSDNENFCLSLKIDSIEADELDIDGIDEISDEQAEANCAEI